LEHRSHGVYAGMVTTARWIAAQSYERDWWADYAAQIAAGSIPQMDWYGWRARQLSARLEALGLSSLTGGNAALVEVGCGPIGVASFFPARERVAIDPLNDFYADNPTLTHLRSSAVDYRTGVGESLPCNTAAFDLAIIENCIDHVRDVDAVMRDLHRVLHHGGVLYLTVNCRTPLGFVVHRALSRLEIDAGHPHTFTVGKTERLLREHGFSVLHIHVGSYLDALRQHLGGPGLRPWLKAVLGTTEFVITVIARKDT
jgi:SAM-dependent methyltransferase